MPAGAPFSLGFALFGWRSDSPSPHHDAAAVVCAPDSWLVDLLHNHLDCKARLHLFRTCRGGREWVLANAHACTLTMPNATSTEQLQGTCTAFSRALGSRGPATDTALDLNKLIADQLLQVPDMLGEAARHVTCLWANEHVSQAFLTAAATAMPCLIAVDLPDLSTPLPPPALLPRLQQLTTTITCSTAEQATAVCASIGLLLPQLTQLDVGRVAPADYPHVFNTATASQTLKKLFTDAHLSDDLLGLLVQHTPGLEELTVPGITVQSDQWREAVWAVKKIRCEPVDGTPTLGLRAERMARLPVNTAGTTRFNQEHMCVEVLEKGLPAAIRERLPLWRFEAPYSEGALEITLFHRLLPPQSQPAALAACLQQLSTLQSGAAGTVKPQAATVLWIAHWDITAQLLQTLTSVATQHHPAAAVRLSVHTLSDATLDLLLEHAPCVQGIEVGQLQLLRDHSSRQCRWTELAFVQGGTVSVWQVARLPQPASGTFKIACFDDDCALQVDVKDCQMGGEVDKLLARLKQDFKFAHPGGLAASKVLVKWTPDQSTPEAQALAMCLRILEAMQVEDGEWHVALHYWVLSTAVIDCLSHLPAWGRVLELPQCLWPFESRVSGRLAGVVPARYHTWCVQGASQHQVLDIVIGVMVQGEECTDDDWGLTLVVGNVEWVEVMREYVSDCWLSDCVWVEREMPAY